MIFREDTCGQMMSENRDEPWRIHTRGNRSATWSRETRMIAS